MAMIVVKTALLSLGLNYGVHYTSARLYDFMCVPHSLSGLLTSLATTASPVCGFMLNTMVVTQNNYAVVLTATLTSALVNALKPPALSGEAN
jgi:hypothetical protein